MNSALTIFKALSDDARLRILRSLGEKDMYVELLAERLQLSAPTVSFHLKKLQAAGLVNARREQYYTVYSLNSPVFEASLRETVFQEATPAGDAMREELYRRRVLRSFMPDGYCETLPAQLKKRVIVYQEIFRHFEAGRQYTEKEINQELSRYHGDYCMVRRAFVEMGWMRREKGVYTVNPDPDLNAAWD